jgi:hypothetical protein
MAANWQIESLLFFPQAPCHGLVTRDVLLLNKGGYSGLLAYMECGLARFYAVNFEVERGQKGESSQHATYLLYV